MIIASEAGHWYTRDGVPCYEIQRSSGEGTRPTTLRDARNLALVPSVTMILKVASKPGLEIWKLNQILLASLTLPRLENETDDEFAHRVIADANEQANKARDKGTAIHAALEQYYAGTIGEEMQQEFRAYLDGVAFALYYKFPEFNQSDWIAERSFASSYGYGGKVDLHSPKGVVVDFKTKEFSETAPIEKLVFPEMAMQLDAYRNGLGMPCARMVNVFVSTLVPGLVKIYEWPEGNYFTRFLHLLHYWQLSSNYDSSFFKSEAA